MPNPILTPHERSEIFNLRRNQQLQKEREERGDEGGEEEIELSPEDERILDKVWDKIGHERKLRRRNPDV